MTVLLSIVSSTMPKSNSLPIFGYYLIAMITLNATGVGVSVCFLALSGHLIDKGELPSHWAYCLLLLKRPLRANRRSKKVPTVPTLEELWASEEKLHGLVLT